MEPISSLTPLVRGNAVASPLREREVFHPSFSKLLYRLQEALPGTEVGHHRSASCLRGLFPFSLRNFPLSNSQHVVPTGAIKFATRPSSYPPPLQL